MSIGKYFGCGTLSSVKNGDLYPAGAGFWMQYTGGDMTVAGARQTNVSCVCDSAFTGVRPTQGTYEKPGTTGQYQLDFHSKYCCPKAPTPSPPSGSKYELCGPAGCCVAPVNTQCANLGYGFYTNQVLCPYWWSDGATDGTCLSPTSSNAYLGAVFLRKCGFTALYNATLLH